MCGDCGSVDVTWSNAVDRVVTMATAPNSCITVFYYVFMNELLNFACRMVKTCSGIFIR